MARSEADFDPGAKYHVAANVPYARYFLADILQFQFHRALSRDCRLHGSVESLLDLRQQGGRPAAQRDAGDGREPSLAGCGGVADGREQMDATAILDYFAPLQKWLDEQNKGKQSGW